MEDVSLGKYAIPFLISIFLALIYKPFDKPDGTSAIKDWLKGYIAVGLGIILSVVTLFYKGLEPTFINYVDYILYGIVIGTSAVGIFTITNITTGGKGK